jgi:hypothetical protein
LYYYYSKKKARENYVTSGHVTDVTSGYGSLPVMTSIPVAQNSSSSSSSDDEESYYILKTNNRFFWVVF